MWQATLIKWLKRAWVWIKHYWYIPVIVFMAGIIYLIGKDRGSVAKTVEKINKVKEKEREEVRKIEQEFEEKQKISQKETKEEQEKIRDAADVKLEKLKKRIQDDLKEIKGDSESIDGELEDLLK